ncbi:hypothetical protein UA08_01364 [Talaromyces atroroseus]|uniref:N-acetyltransferase domain-containing protein n=1 Tax=Talaromyces atroroseus TaxID=1441469 RepID=A0A1Q5Q9Y1_TALAT|nr:hypothetical protein UA08_01364 [Talaromyces atroroseus]OKL62720.1 hypothetical protein UA08_01364 [Talaromyces atroroseus]
MADVDAIVQIAVDVIPQEPQVLYQYPYTDKFPEDCYRCTTEEIKGFVENASPASDILVMVAEVDNEKSPSGKTIIAHTVWDLMAVGNKKAAALREELGSVNDTADKFDCSDRRDADWNRIEYYSRIISRITWEYLEPTDRTTLPRTYIHLIRVATSPQWQRHGAGTLLCNWGIDVAQKHNLQIGLFATPSGRGLYTKLGFQKLTTAFVQMPEEKENVSMTVMKWYPQPQKAPGQALNAVKRLLFCGVDST